MTRVKCVNADGQPRLVAGGIYRLVLDVTEATRPGHGGENVSGYLVTADGDTVAIPYVYDRERFAFVPEGH